ncbi:MAG: hypothetical protein QOE08_63 [Thermoleophilaceae bacterium]|nr:hypothetical protein [Thermoleophilaceae bacterium]
MDALPQRGAGVRALTGLPLPPARMPRWRAGRPLKRWRYVGVYGPELMLCAGDVRVGPMPQRFWAIALPDGRVESRTTFGRGGVALEGSRVRVDAGEVQVDIALEEDAGVESVHRSGARGYVWTRKQAGVAARGEVREGDRAWTLDDARAVVDDTAGYHQRRTTWTWSAGVGRTASGAPVGWNLVTGVNDDPSGSERTVWLGGEPREVGPVEFAADLSSVEFAEGGSLRFGAWGERADSTNALVVRSAYRQPFGTFSGTLPGGVELAAGYGVMEWHDARW